MRLTNVSSTTSQLILEALLAAQEKDCAEQACAYELNAADIIKEEDYEESSVGEMSYRKGGAGHPFRNRSISNSGLDRLRNSSDLAEKNENKAPNNQTKKTSSE